MPNKPRAATGRSTVKRVAKSAIPNGAQDVTSESPDDLVSRIKLICDNDINVHLFRADGKLFMLTVQRNGVSGTAPAEVA